MRTVGSVAWGVWGFLEWTGDSEVKGQTLNSSEHMDVGCQNSHIDEGSNMTPLNLTFDLF